MAGKQVPQWADVNASLTEGHIKKLLRPDLGDLSFVGSKHLFEDLRDDSAVAASLDARDGWDLVEENRKSALRHDQPYSSEATAQLLKEIEDFNPAAASTAPAEAKAELERRLREHRKALGAAVRPVGRIAPDLGIDIAALSRAVKDAEEIAAKKPAIDQVLANLQTAAAEEGATEAAKFYRKQADDEEKAAGRSFKWVVGTVVAFIAVAGLIFFTPGLKPSDNLSSGSAIVEVAGRTLILAVLAFLITLTARDYRAHRHLSTVSRFKEHALNATPLLHDSIANNEEHFGVVLATLVDAVFAVPETGFVNAGGETTTITTPAAALMPGLTGRNSP